MIFVYSGGKLVAEYSTKPPPQNPTTKYVATDTLQSVRAITNQDGEVISRRDFLPFGKEIPNSSLPGHSTSLRTSALKYEGDDVRQKFTGYQKDEESGLDFAEARMYNNRHARFTAVDPLLASGKSANPQTFNRYVYVMNSPLNFTDPTGLQVASCTECNWYTNGKGAYRAGPMEGFNRVTGTEHVDAEDGYSYTVTGNSLVNHGSTALLNILADDSVLSCIPAYQCAGLRDPARDRENFQAGRDFTTAFPLGVSNRAKGYLDLPLRDFGQLEGMFPGPVGMIPRGTTLESMGFTNRWFTYYEARNANEAVGLFAGGAALDTAVTAGGAGFARSFATFSGRGSTFSERLFKSETFGKESRLFGNKHFDMTGEGKSGLLNKPGLPVKFGWSRSRDNPLSLSDLSGSQRFRLGILSNGNRAKHHFYIPRVAVSDDVANTFVYRPAN